MPTNLLKYRILCVSFAIYLLATVLAGCKDTATVSTGDVAPAISCNDLTGEYVSLSQLKNKVVVLYFWSSKCCSDKLKLLEPFYLQHKYNGLAIVAIEVGGSKDGVASFVRNSGLTFINLTDEYGSLSRSFRVVGFPTIFVIDKNGVIRKKVSGDIKIDQLGRLVTPLL
jgi:cytochrome c biogenesis protein CcmG, thiol:disulfide interchange protein DsbE